MSGYGKLIERIAYGPVVWTGTVERHVAIGIPPWQSIPIELQDAQLLSLVWSARCRFGRVHLYVAK